MLQIATRGLCVLTRLGNRKSKSSKAVQTQTEPRRVVQINWLVRLLQCFPIFAYIRTSDYTNLLRVDSQIPNIKVYKNAKSQKRTQSWSFGFGFGFGFRFGFGENWNYTCSAIITLTDITMLLTSVAKKQEGRGPLAAPLGTPNWEPLGYYVQSHTKDCFGTITKTKLPSFANVWNIDVCSHWTSISFRKRIRFAFEVNDISCALQWDLWKHWQFH